MTFAEIIIRKKQKETKTKVNRKNKTKLQHRKHENKNKVTNKESPGFQWSLFQRKR